MGFLVAQTEKNLPAIQKFDPWNKDSIPGSWSFCGEGTGYPFQYSCLDNPMDRGAWWARVHKVAKVGRHWVTKHACTQPNEYDNVFASRDLDFTGRTSYEQAETLSYSSVSLSSWHNVWDKINTGWLFYK